MAKAIPPQVDEDVDEMYGVYEWLKKVAAGPSAVQQAEVASAGDVPGIDALADASAETDTLQNESMPLATDTHSAERWA